MTSGHQNGTPPTSCDLQVTLQLAESLRAAGQYHLVVQYYRWSSAAFVARGEPHHALAVCVLLTELVPHCLHTHAMIAEQYRQLGEAGHAATIYERIAHTHHAAGRMNEAAQVYRIVVDMDPTSAPRRVALAEACVQLGELDEAHRQFETVASQLRAAGRVGEYIWTAHRILTLRPGDVPTLRDLVRLQLETGDVYGGVQTLQTLLAVSARDDVGRELMAQAFAAQGQLALAARSAVMLADELRGRGFASLPDAQRILQHALYWSPADPNVHELLHEVQRQLLGRNRARRGSHVQGEIRAPARSPGVPEPIPRGRPGSDEEDTNVLALRRRNRRTVPYRKRGDGRVVAVDFHQRRASG